MQLEQNLSETRFLLDEAQSQLESKKNELTNLETVREELEAQRSYFTKELEDDDIKRKLYFLSIL